MSFRQNRRSSGSWILFIGFFELLNIRLHLFSVDCCALIVGVKTKTSKTSVGHRIFYSLITFTLIHRAGDSQTSLVSIYTDNAFIVVHKGRLLPLLHSCNQFYGKKCSTGRSEDINCKDRACVSCFVWIDNAGGDPDNDSPDYQTLAELVKS